jgi:DNA-binding MarR family transcriptional regulator
MDAHFKILTVINIYGNANFTRIMNFSGNPEISTRNNLKQLIAHGFVRENAGEKGTRTMYSLTKKGEKYYNAIIPIIPDAFKIDYMELAPATQEKFITIMTELEKGPKTNSQLIDKLDITANDLNTHLIFLQAQNYIELKLIDDILYNSIVKKRGRPKKKKTKNK